MPRVKKTRKVTQSVPRPKVRPTENAPKRNKKLNGKAPGNRNSLKDGNPGNNQAGKAFYKKDQRIGSKKKIALLASTKPEPATTRLIPKFKTPQEELSYIENDAKLQFIVEKIDSDQEVDRAEEHYAEHLLQRHQTLCELLGISEDNDSVENEHSEERSDDLLDMLEKPPGKLF